MNGTLPSMHDGNLERIAFTAEILDGLQASPTLLGHLICGDIGEEAGRDAKGEEVLGLAECL